jgi:hypothetical protein
LGRISTCSKNHESSSTTGRQEKRAVACKVAWVGVEPLQTTGLEEHRLSAQRQNSRA